MIRWSQVVRWESEFASVEEAEAHESWYRAKVQASLDDQCPFRPHDQVMATLRDIIEAKRRAHASDSVALKHKPILLISSITSRSEPATRKPPRPLQLHRERCFSTVTASVTVPPGASNWHTSLRR